jgi:Transposase IS66 family
MLDDLDLGGITDPAARRLLGVVLERVAGLVAEHAALVAAQQELVAENAALREALTRVGGADWRNQLEHSLAEAAQLREERQRLRDEVARLKGEQGQPRILPKRQHSSEEERRLPRGERRRQAKAAQVRIDRTELRPVEAPLPSDAEFKGYAEVVVQEVRLETETVQFRLAKYYAPSTGKSYQASLPAGYSGHFGPGLRALVLYLGYATNTSQAKIRAFLTSVGVVISTGTIARMLDVPAVLAAEEAAVRQAGLASSAYQHLDATPTRVDGVEHHCHVLSAPLYVSYTTTPTKDRLAVLDVLRLSSLRTFALTPAAWALLATGAPLAERTQQALRALPQAVVWDSPTFFGLLDTHLPWLGSQQRSRVVDAAAIGAYRLQTAVPVIDTLIVDAAPQFVGLTPDLALCWVHEGRHYKKLTPYLPLHQALLDAVLDAFWGFYRDLLAYRTSRPPADADALRAAFEAIFTCQTGYADLDACLARTYARKDALLRVLEKPDLPLHNNPAELAARQRVRKRDVSFGARSPAGIRAWDSLQTLLGTAAKLGVNLLHYLRDRLSGALQLPALADLITQRAAQPADATASSLLAAA